MSTQSKIEKMNDLPQVLIPKQLSAEPVEDPARNTQHALEQLKQEMADLTPSPSSRIVRARMNA